MNALGEQLGRYTSWSGTIAIVTAALAGYSLARAKDEYEGWLALGPGGLPHDFRGYVANILLTATFAKSETRSLQMYDAPAKNATGWKDATSEEKTMATRSFLKDPLVRRTGPQSSSKPYCAPQREHNADVYIDPKIREVSLLQF
jgi:hypothetical protein